MCIHFFWLIPLALSAMDSVNDPEDTEKIVEIVQLKREYKKMSKLLAGGFEYDDGEPVLKPAEVTKHIKRIVEMSVLNS